MNSNTETNLISDEALDGVVGGSFFGNIWKLYSGQSTNTQLGIQAVAYAAPWGQVGHAVSSVVKVFKFW